MIFFYSIVVSSPDSHYEYFFYGPETSIWENICDECFEKAAEIILEEAIQHNTFMDALEIVQESICFLEKEGYTFIENNSPKKYDAYMFYFMDTGMGKKDKEIYDRVINHNKKIHSSLVKKTKRM